MEHMVRKLVCLATAAGLGFGALADDEPADPEVFSQGGVSWTDPSIVAKMVGGRTLLIVTNVAAAATVTAERTVTLARALVVGGGGGGGSTIGGGGGGGGATEWSDADLVLEAGGALEISLGRGGIGGGRTGNTASTWPRGTNGGASTLTLVGGEWSIEALGGGGGGAWNQTSANGGMTVANPGGPCKGAARPAAGTSGYLSGTSSGESPGGGAGSGGDGGNGVNRGAAGNGGIGYLSDITGEPAYYGGGGAGSGGNSCTSGGKGGLGGGANGVDANASAADALKDGVNGLGGGGAGGSHNQSNNGGNGGSGCVILVFAEGDLTERQLVVAEIPDQPFDGEPSVPAPVVTNKKSGEPLDVADYDVTYSNNFGIGTATVTVVGKGVYLGECKVLTVEVVAPSEGNRLLIAGDFSRKIIPSGAVAKVANFRVTDAENRDLDPSGYAVGYANNTATGIATVWAKGTTGALEGEIAVATFEVVTLPEGYQPVGWIRSSGTQCINTGIVPGATTTLTMDFNTGTYVHNTAFFGQNWAGSRYLLNQQSDSYMFHGNSTTLRPVVNNAEAHVEVTGDDTLIMDIAGIVTTNSISRASTTSSMYVFAANSKTYCSSFTLYALSISQGGTLVRDLVPVVRMADGKPGLFDLAHPDAAMLENVGTGEFLTDATRLAVAPIGGQTFLGEALKPDPAVTDRDTGAVLVRERDYTVAYEGNDAAGVGRVIVTGKGDYAGYVGTVKFNVARVIYAKGDALDSGSGASWADAMTWTNAIQCAATSGVPCEVWVAGTNLLTASKGVAFGQPTVIRGGFAGTERTPEERLAGRRSVVDGQGTACCLSFSCTAPVAVESLLLTRSPNQALYCGTCSADVLVTNCAITVSGYSSSWGGNYKAPIDTTGGGGATFVGTSAATLRLCGCDISGMSSVSGNDAGSGGGAYFKGYKRVYLDDCTVMTNATRCNRASQAFGLQFSNQPFEMTRCQVLGNRCTGGSGIAVQMSGSCSGSVMRNCIFAGNVNSAGSTGVVHVNMNATASTLLVENCTFAYNFVSGTSALCISCGTVSVRNTIFYANMRSLTSTRGADIHVATAGAADVAYGLFGGSGTAYCTSAGDGVLTLDGNAVAADPLFVTDTESFKALAKASAVPSGTWTVPGNATLCSFDLHLLSSEGYFDATGGLHTAAGVLSPAIDAADPEDGFSLESEPNGGRRNLGAYGGTCFASRTPYADARVSGAITASWPTAYTQPEIRFALGGEGVYSATAVVRVSTDGGETWCFQSDALSGLTNGEAIAVLVPAYFPEGSELTVSVSVTAAGKTSVSTTEEPIAVEGALPPWDGKGGGAGVVHVRPGATGRGTGASWTDAVTTFAEGLALLSKTRSELWFAGTNELAAGVSLSAGYPVTIRGGFVGVENTPEERPRGRISVLDGQDAADSCFSLTHSQVALVDSILFTRSTQRGFYASSSADLTLTNCAVRCCAKASGWGGNYKAPIETVGGGGATFVGTSAATVRLVGCDLSGMSSFTDHDAGSGGGAYFKGYRHAYLDNCTVMTNAVRADRAAQATGLQFSNQPATLEGCLFAGNRPTRSGIVVQFSGACSNSVLRNCRFVGSVDSGGSGLVCANMSTSSDTLLVENCTFAYNLVPNCSALRVNTGAATVRNSIFFGNVKVGTSANGADIACGASGAATAEWSFFGGTGADYTTGSSTVSPNCITTGDPLFVTTTEAFLTLTGVAALPVGSGSFPSLAASCALDVHLLSSAGHRVNGDESWHLAEGLRSPAIDGGDTASDFSREPDDNGGCINMGAYGNTPEASKTPSFKVGVDGAVTVEFEDGYTQPTVRFTMGGEGAYSAEAVISVYVDGSETPAFVSAPQKGLSIGMPVGFRVPAYFRPGATLVAKVDLSAGDKLASATSEGTPAAGELPPWDGKGGGANVVHVRPGATGRGDGSSWTDAYVDFHTALKSLSAGKDEVWVSGTNVLTSSSPDFAFTASLAIRGGFDATECAASARKGGSRSRVDGCDAYNCLTFHNAADVTVTLDGIDFVRGGSHGIRKASGAGDLFVTNCGFLVCGAVNSVNNYQSDTNGNGGSGAGITGGGTATFVGCDICGNHLSGSGHDGCVGVGLMAFGLRRLYLDSCNVISNVNNFWRGGGGQGVYCYNTPVEISKTRFAANDASCSYASVLWLNGSCSGSIVRNCVFTGNSNGAANGMFRVSMGAADMTVLVENCTLAYNFDSGNTALNLVRGDATVRNCVFQDNLVAASSTIGADINVGDEARADVSHSLFGVEGMNSVTCSAGGETNFLAGVLFGDAKLVTDAETFRAGAKVTGEVPRSGWTLPAATVRAAYNVHLRGGSGYVDETTGETVKTWAKRRYDSPAIDAGDPAARCVEPKPNGHRVNLGAYGNTPWATMSPAGGALIVR